MRILHPRLFLGICGAACLIAFALKCAARLPRSRRSTERRRLGARARRRALAPACSRRQRAADRRERAHRWRRSRGHRFARRHPPSAARRSLERLGPAARGWPQLGLLRRPGNWRQPFAAAQGGCEERSGASRPNSLTPTSRAHRPWSARSRRSRRPRPRRQRPARPRRHRRRAVRRP